MIFDDVGHGLYDVDHYIIGDLVRPCNCSGHESGSDQAGGTVGMSWKKPSIGGGRNCEGEYCELH